MHKVSDITKETNRTVRYRLQQKKASTNLMTVRVSAGVVQ